MNHNITFTNHNPITIWNRLAAKLGRQPTDQEVRQDLDRILGKKTSSMGGTNYCEDDDRDTEARCFGIDADSY